MNVSNGHLNINWLFYCTNCSNTLKNVEEFCIWFVFFYFLHAKQKNQFEALLFLILSVFLSV